MWSTRLNGSIPWSTARVHHCPRCRERAPLPFPCLPWVRIESLWVEGSSEAAANLPVSRGTGAHDEHWQIWWQVPTSTITHTSVSGLWKRSNDGGWFIVTLRFYFLHIELMFSAGRLFHICCWIYHHCHFSLKNRLTAVCSQALNLAAEIKLKNCSEPNALFSTSIISS